MPLNKPLDFYLQNYFNKALAQAIDLFDALSKN